MDRGEREPVLEEAERIFDLPRDDGLGAELEAARRVDGCDLGDLRAALVVVELLIDAGRPEGAATHELERVALRRLEEERAARHDDWPERGIHVDARAGREPEPPRRRAIDQGVSSAELVGVLDVQIIL